MNTIKPIALLALAIVIGCIFLACYCLVRSNKKDQAVIVTAICLFIASLPFAAIPWYDADQDNRSNRFALLVVVLWILFFLTPLIP